MQAATQAPGEVLKGLIGVWDAEAVVTAPDGSTAKGRIVLTGTEISLGRGVRTEMRGTIEGLGDYEEHDLWSFDENTGKVHMFSVTSTGEVHDHVGEIRPDGSFEAVWEGLAEGAQAKELVRIEFLSADELVGSGVYEFGSGERGSRFEMRLRRRN